MNNRANKRPRQIKEISNRPTLVTSESHISGSKMSIYEWSSLKESTTHLLKNRHLPLRAPNPMLGHIIMGRGRLNSWKIAGLKFFMTPTPLGRG